MTVSFLRRQAPVESSSSYWRSYSQQAERHRRGLSSLFRRGDDDDEDEDDDSCVCVYFDRCSDGNLLSHGADLLDFRWVRPLAHSKPSPSSYGSAMVRLGRMRLILTNKKKKIYSNIY